MNNVQIKSFGRYTPNNIISNDDLSKIVDTSDEWIFSRTGIKNRFITTGENTSDICAKAAENVLENANVSPKDIDIIIVATISPDYYTPSTACIVQSLIGASNAFAFDISAACSGFVYGLSIAEKFIRTGAYKNALVIGGEALSKILNWEDRRTCVLFGDGAGGAYLEASDNESFIAEDICSDGTRYNSLTGGHLPARNPYTEKKEYYPYLEMDGRAIFDFAVKTIPKSLQILSEKSNIPIEEIKYIIPHQANSRIFDTIARKMKIDISKFYLNIDRFGNTSAGTIPIALSEMVEKDLITIGSNEKIALTGFGGGLTWGSMLINI